MRNRLSPLLAIALVLLACSRTEPEIVAETYPPEVGPVIPQPGAPGDLVWISEPAIGISSLAGQWKYNSIGVPSADDNQPGAVMVALSPDHGSILRCVRVSIVGASGHQKTPEHPASVSVWRFDLDTAGPEMIAVASDDASDLDAYEHVHQLDACAEKDEIVDLSMFRYQASLFNEHGFDSLPGLKVLGVRRGVVPKP